LSIGFDSNIGNGRSVAGFFNRGKVFPAWQGFSTDENHQGMAEEIMV
jgi:hypothetical protein